MMKRFFLALACISILGVQARGQIRGCQSPAYPYNIYFVENGVFNGVPSFDFLTYADIAPDPKNCVTPIGATNSSCWINVPGAPQTSKYGTLVNYYIEQCPIDGSGWSLMAALSIVAFISIRKKTVSDCREDQKFS